MPNTALIALAMVGTGVILAVIVLIQSIIYRKRIRDSKRNLDD